jgi:pimeloyl-ACP methyl ester carboxylesterase
MSAAYREQLVMLGPRKSLVSVMTLPAEGNPDSSLPTIVILNAGIIHHVGPNRLSVLLARELAGSGASVVRFDLSGVGDSPSRDDGLAPLDAALADIREALDSLQALRGSDRFILVGLCSGANHAIVYAAGDPRVNAVALLDPYVPKTLHYYVLHYFRRLLRLAAWQGALRRLGGAWRKSSSEPPAPLPAAAAPATAGAAQTREAHSFLEARYRACIERGVRMLLVLTDGRQDIHNHLGQFKAAFPRIGFGDLLTAEYFSAADHTFSVEAQRARLFALVQRWLKSQSA